MSLPWLLLLLLLVVVVLLLLLLFAPAEATLCLFEGEDEDELLTDGSGRGGRGGLLDGGGFRDGGCMAAYSECVLVMLFLVVLCNMVVECVWQQWLVVVKSPLNNPS